MSSQVELELELNWLSALPAPESRRLVNDRVVGVETHHIAGRSRPAVARNPDPGLASAAAGHRTLVDQAPPAAPAETAAERRRGCSVPAAGADCKTTGDLKGRQTGARLGPRS